MHYSIYQTHCAQRSESGDRAPRVRIVVVDVLKVGRDRRVGLEVRGRRREEVCGQRRGGLRPEEVNEGESVHVARKSNKLDAKAKRRRVRCSGVARG